MQRPGDRLGAGLPATRAGLPSPLPPPPPAHSGPDAIETQDSLREKCGVFGVFAPREDVARIAFFGLYALQHRGQESAGIATAHRGRIHAVRGMGLVSQVFDEEALAGLKGEIAIGHTRYSTTGSTLECNAQPFIAEGDLGQIALAHNGNVVNAEPLQQELRDMGVSFTSSTDSEVIAAAIANAAGASWTEKTRNAMRRLLGAYSLVLLTKESLMAVRDPLGIRPLCLGRLRGGWVVASETCALDHLGAQFVREVDPGEVVRIDRFGVSSYRIDAMGPPPPALRPYPSTPAFDDAPGGFAGRLEEVAPAKQRGPRAFCIFEYIYFARPDSLMDGNLVYLARERMGERLADEYPVEADVVIGVPDSAVPAAIGYARRSGIPYSEGLIKNRYVGRTFIEPSQQIREAGVRLKFNPLPEVLRDKRVVVVDDSIVRGTTTPRVVELLRRAGAREVHLRISSPPIKNPCFFGVDMATKGELIAAHRDVEGIRRYLGADSLGYLSLEGLVWATQVPGESFCTACLTGNYPVPVQLELDKLALESTWDHDPFQKSGVAGDRLR